jgi:hypothetical protein
MLLPRQHLRGMWMKAALAGPAVQIAMLTIVNLVIWGMFSLAISVLRGSRFDPEGKYVAAGLLALALFVMIGVGVQRLRVGPLFGFIAIGPAAMGMLGDIVTVTLHGPDNLTKGGGLFSIDHIAGFIAGAGILTVSYALLALLLMIAMSLLRIPNALERFAADIGLLETEIPKAQ